MPAEASVRQLSDTLSARSYLEHGQAAYWSRHEDYSPCQPSGNVQGPTVLRNQELCTEFEPGPRLNHETSQRRPRKRGRPRLEENEKAAEDRRSQVRRAQRTYRLKKEATVQSLNTRVADLEGSLRTISDILVNFQDAVVRSDLNLSTPDLSPSSSDAVDRILAELDKTGLWPDRRDVRPESFARPGVVTHEPFFKPINYIERGLLDVFGYQVSHQSDETWQVKDEAQHQRRQDHLSPRHVPRLFPSFSGDPELRRLFEHAHQADSRFVACLLGLLRCLPDENASTANSVDAGSQYQIGDLKATLQSVMESTLGLGDLEKQPGYDQRWVHCRDVRAYLERMGIMLDRSSVLVDIPLQAAIAIQEDSQTGSEGERERDDRVDSGNQNNSRNESTAPDTTGPSDYFLDVECFFNLLRTNINFLNYAPGFRRADINAALGSAMRKRP